MASFEGKIGCNFWTDEDRKLFFTYFPLRIWFPTTFWRKIFQNFASKKFRNFFGQFFEKITNRGHRTGFYFLVFWDHLTLGHPKITFLEMAFFMRVNSSASTLWIWIYRELMWTERELIWTEYVLMWTDLKLMWTNCKQLWTESFERNLLWTIINH